MDDYPGTVSSDCIKIAGGETLVEYITIENSKIYNCSEDAIDVTGRKNITYSGNEIYNAKQVQVKGGTENITIANNYLHNMTYGIVGQGMDCTEDANPGYCGNPEHDEIPVADRFQAKNVTIKNNYFKDISNRTIDPSGWKNVSIHRNTFDNSPSNSDAYAITIREGVTSAFFDDKAIEYCDLHPSECPLSCSSSAGECVKIRLRANDIRVAENYFISNATWRNIFKFDSNSVDQVESICLHDNKGENLWFMTYYSNLQSYTKSSSKEDMGFCSTAPLGIAQIDHNWKAISIPNQTTDVVLLFTPPSSNESDPGVVSMRNGLLDDRPTLATYNFELSFSEWDYLKDAPNASHAVEDTAFLYLPEGTYSQADGSVWQVGKVTINKTNTNVVQFKSINFAETFDAIPHVFTSLQTANGAETVSLRVNDVTTSGFKVSLQEQQSSANTDHTDEVVGYVAIYNSNNSGIANIEDHTFSYHLGTLSTDDNYQSVWGVELKMQEEASVDTETTHTIEVINLLKIDGQVFSQDVDFTGSDSAAIRRKSTGQAIPLSKLYSH